MGIFSFFRKRDPEDIVTSVSQGIVAAAIEARGELVSPDDPRSVMACCEVAYLLLHLVDRELFSLFGESGRDRYFSIISERVITVYILAVLIPRDPGADVAKIGRQMLDVLNSRQATYSKCNSVLAVGGSLPSPGSMVFALCVFMQMTLGKPTINYLDNLLAGNVDASSIDVDEVPDLGNLVLAAAFIASRIDAIRFRHHLKRLR